ncbi:tetrathionate reductase family octaheme c-type cytochrome [Desulfatibacillum aliphaticivorans]|nr:tetrathionate reductase family octaheme c-type cytochrome [Desulfatibacillum aliphaticivorans]
MRTLFKPLLIISASLILIAGGLFFINYDAGSTLSQAFAAAPEKAPKKVPSPPKPPEKVNPDGTPWSPAAQVAAMERAKEVPPFVKKVKAETAWERKQRLGDDAPTLQDQDYAYVVLNSPIVNKEQDMYEPVRFMHKKHAAVTGDCLKCHHASADEPGAPETAKCSACHQEAFNPEFPERPGLKAAYHRQCMTCHEEQEKGPLGCTDCHGKNVPDHSKLVKLPKNPSPTQVTTECLRCHEDQGEDMLKSAHWLWKGPSPYTVDGEKRVDSGKATNTINNFCIALPSNWPRCTSCHAGYGWKDETFDFTDKSHIDCLICHDTTDTYAKVPTDAGMPYPQLDLVEIAEHVGKPSRKTCGDCHFQGGGGDAVKHGDMNAILYYPTRKCDVHMGDLDFQCHDCHKTRNHKISGRSLSLPVAEGARSCEDCHTSQPHHGNNLLDHHLNRHGEHIACMTCHSPVYAKCKPTKTWWDWSKAGDKKREVHKDKYGMPDYFWKKGEFLWDESVQPTYAWYNGTVERYLIGDKIDDDGVTEITQPVGGIKDAKSRIAPFKIMAGKQPADKNNRTLLTPNLFGPKGYWKNVDWDQAFKIGAEATGIEYSGEYEWEETKMYWSLNHEVTPKEMALSCVQCHESLTQERSCDRCHQDKRDVDFKALSYKGVDFKTMAARGRDTLDLVEKTDYINFKALGYKGDPIIYGGRFKQLPLGWHKDGKEEK